jgi:hypothetical protein
MRPSLKNASPFIPSALAGTVVPGRVVAVEYPDAAFVPCHYLTATTPSTVAQFEPTVGVVVLYPPKLLRVQFSAASSHIQILPFPRQPRSAAGVE